MENRISKLFFLGSGVLAASVPVAAQICRGDLTGNNRMNIIFIMSDDHSYQTVGAYGQALNKTPNIDRIGNEGVVFERGYVANSISGPSRACMLTGKHSHKNGFINNSTVFDGSQQTFPKLLQKVGYKTAIVGKWHLVSQPTGFDYWNILTGQGDYYNPNFIDNGVRKQYKGYATDITTDLAMQWLDKNKDNGQPFCLLVHHKAPHRTWMPDAKDLGAYDNVTFPLPENFYDDYKGRQAAEAAEMRIDRDMDMGYDLKMYTDDGDINYERPDLHNYAHSLYRSRMDSTQQAAWDAYYNPIIEKFKKAKLSGKALAEWKYQRYMRDYCSVINSVDRNIGRLLKYLEDNKLLDNTLIVYTSDQGFYMGEHGWFDKRFMYEESFRTPILARLPKGAKHVRDRHLVQNIDFAPTFLELAGAKVPEDIQGESLLPILKGDNVKDWRNSLYYHFYEYPGEHNTARHYGVFDGRYKLMHFYKGADQWEFYDLKNDPKEMHNLYGDPKYKKEIDAAMAELKRLQVYYDDPLTD